MVKNSTGQHNDGMRVGILSRNVQFLTHADEARAVESRMT
jgi:hypothetical protein